MRCQALFMLVALLPLTLQAEDSLLKSWVWSQDSASATQAAPVGERYFRRAFEVQKPLKKAICQLTADNEFLLYVNGKEVWFSKDWKQLQSITITQHLRSGRNVVAVKADNWGPAANPAGLIGAVSLSFADGTSQTLYTDENWVVSSAHSKRWQMPEFDDSSWLPALVVGRHGCEPWGVLEAPQEGPQSAHWPEAVAFLADDCSILKAHLKLFRVGKSRAYSMFDVPVPSLMARKLCVLRPARPERSHVCCSMRVKVRSDHPASHSTADTSTFPWRRRMTNSIASIVYRSTEVNRSV